MTMYTLTTLIKKIFIPVTDDIREHLMIHQYSIISRKLLLDLEVLNWLALFAVLDAILLIH